LQSPSALACVKNAGDENDAKHGVRSGREQGFAA
jgi:hypothetical protein